MNYSPEQILDLWKKGKFLGEAAWYYTDYKIWENWQKYAANNPKINRDNETLPKNLSDILGDFVKIHAELRQHSEQKEEAKDLLWDDLFKKITRGNLLAIGFKLPNPSNFPDFIPLHMWPPENTDTNKSSISANNIEYGRVRIIKKSALNNKVAYIPKTPPNISVKDRKVGRPSLKAEIVTAYEYLKKHGRIDYSKFLKSHTEIIQKTVMQLYPAVTNNEGMEHEAIRRAIGDCFKVDQATSKSTSKL